VSHHFGPYLLTQRIGRGGMGEVWAAIHLGLEMPCAIKLMRSELGADEDRRTYEAMFLGEASLCSQLRNGRIVRVHNSGSIDGRLFIAMDLVDGVNLRDFLRTIGIPNGGPLPLPLVAFVIGELLEALDYAHDRTIGGQEGGVVHGDVTPGNVMISSRGEVLLTDFGLARLVGSTSPCRHAIGTPAYMAPEQARGHACRESDLYAVGALLHELLTGQPPLPKRATIADVLTLAKQQVAAPMRDDIPAPLEALRRALLAKDFARRIGTAAEALAILGEWPGHRHRAAQLRELYREHIGRPHSGLTFFHGIRLDPRALFELDGTEDRQAGRAPGQAAALALDDTQPLGGALELAHGRVPAPSSNERSCSASTRSPSRFPWMRSLLSYFVAEGKSPRADALPPGRRT
jgi:serine/threonine protein kinase